MFSINIIYLLRGAMPNVTSQNASLAGTLTGTTGISHKVIGTHKTHVLVDGDNVTRVVYHETPVVSFNESSIRLSTGGWWTRTTKVRMNQASQEFELGFRVFQKKEEWFVDYQNETHPFDTDELVLQRFEDSRSEDKQYAKLVR